MDLCYKNSLLHLRPLYSNHYIVGGKSTENKTKNRMCFILLFIINDLKSFCPLYYVLSMIPNVRTE